jgi:Cu(I)/Ag(I) efflux system membrane fusion protein
VVVDGLKVGEEIVTQGAFSVDASAQLEGKPSMMNPEGGKIPAMPGMDIPADTKTKENDPMPGMDMPKTEKSNQNTEPAENVVDKDVKQATFAVSGNCEMCQDRIQKAAQSVNGVKSAVWEIESKKMHVEYNSALTDVDAIQLAIAHVGHDTEKHKALDEVYEQLPVCCLYRNK